MDSEPTASHFAATAGAAMLQRWNVDDGEPSAVLTGESRWRDADVLGFPIACETDAPPIGGYAKRAFDATVAVVALFLLLPLFLVIAALVKVSDGGAVFYRHQRVGQNGRLFGCLKFRTMVADSDAVLQRHLRANAAAREEWHATQKLKDDPRITPLGQILRKCSLDELPQLWNILKGEMSFVGPRPIVSSEVRKYGDDIASYLRARPGLTGAWQVNGRNEVEYERRVEFDRQYVENWSFWRDLGIVCKTFVVVATSRGCY
ncbi:MAG TPA: sugar transferase [Stellaceae bacterium]|nr:sugar transferase [Stellaceae bacterium]